VKWEIMDRDETIEIMKLMIRFDPRIGDSEDDVKGWQIGLGGLSPGRCREAVALHYRSSTDRIMPAHVRALARSTTDGDAQSATVAPPGEVLCADCARVHRPEEACAELVARPWPRPIGSLTKAITAEPESATGAGGAGEHPVGTAAGGGARDSAA
jgi:hypothetical protein